MWIVLDTNIFYKDLGLKKDIDLLFKVLKKGGFSVRIPEVIIQETINHYRNIQQSLIIELHTNLRKLNGISFLQPTISGIDQQAIGNDIQNYENHLRSKISLYGEIVPFPKVTYQELVDKAINRKKPFDGKGEGFRDALIWETILELVIQEDCEGIYYISDNKRDFSLDGKLHPDLENDLVNRGFKTDKVIYFSSIKDIIDDLLHPIVEELKIEKAIKKGTHSSIELYGIADPHIWDLIAGFRIDSGCLPAYQDDNEDLMILYGDSDYKPNEEDLDVRRLSKTELIITASYDLDCIVGAFVPRVDLYSKNLKELGFYPAEPNWNETYGYCEIRLPFKVTLRYIFNEESEEVETAVIVDAECLNNKNYK